MAIRSLEALEKACENKNIYDVILEDDCLERGVTREESEKKMADLYAAMQHSAQNYTPTLRSASGMAGGDGAKMRSYVKAGKTICGDELGQVIAQALEMGENNACMKCIVAAPTAGSCGVMPAVLLPYQKRMGLGDEEMVHALYIAGAIGQTVASKASIAGAAGGCQYEIGTASAMAAAALCYLGGGDAEAICHAAALAIKSRYGAGRNPLGCAAGRGHYGHEGRRGQDGCFSARNGLGRHRRNAERRENCRRIEIGIPLSERIKRKLCALNG